jgi:hypothetical protein
MSSWTLSFGATAEGKVVLLLEPLGHGRPESMTLSPAAAQSLKDDLTRAIIKAKQHQRTHHDPD